MGMHHLRRRGCQPRPSSSRIGGLSHTRGRGPFTVRTARCTLDAMSDVDRASRGTNQHFIPAAYLGRFSDLLMRGYAGANGTPLESLWQWDGSHVRKLWASALPPTLLQPSGQFLFDAGWTGVWAPRFTPASVIGGCTPRLR